MAESENYRKGSQIRAELMGEKYAAEMAKSVYDDPMMKKFGDYAREAVFGMLWSRPGLDLKTRTLICVISDTAQARWPELHIGIDVVELHQIMVSLGMFNVSNQYTFGAIFERDPSSPAQLARTRELACEVVLRFLAA